MVSFQDRALHVLRDRAGLSGAAFDAIRPRLGKVRAAQFAALAERFKDFDPDPGSGKYLNVEAYLPYTLENYVRPLGLDKASPRWILDIGCGMGYFALLAEAFGHRTMGLDLDDNPLYDAGIEAFGLSRVAFEIEAGKKLPELGGRFDLVTAFAVCFNGLWLERMWGAPEWKFFLDDILENTLAPGGTLYLQLNADSRTGSYCDDATKALFASYGGRVSEKSTSMCEVVLGGPVPLPAASPRTVAARLREFFR